LKVIHLISGGDTGGAKTHIHYLLSGISKNIDVLLVCFMRGEFSDEASALGIPTMVLEGGLLKNLSQLRKIIREGGFDIIHSHGARGNLMASLLRRMCALPMVTTVHSDPKLDYLGRPIAALIYGTLNSLSLKRADYLVGVSDSMKELLTERGFSPNRIFTIYNGVDFSVVPKNDDRLGYLRSLGLKADEHSVVVGIAARLDPVKDVATLVRGFAEAEKSCPSLRLIIAGDGVELTNLKALASELGVSKKICFAGWISDINSFFAAIDINTLTSLSETFPYAITEGARAKLPTVSSSVGGVPKLIVDGETGFLFRPGDAGTLAKKLTLLAQSAELRKKLGEAVYEKARREFSVEATTGRQLAIYGEVLSREEKKRTGERSGVVICGAYGMGNSGDDAILEAIVSEMRKIDEFMSITALSRMPKATRLKYGVDSAHMFDIFALNRIVRGTRLYLSGGGSLIQNVTSRRSLWYYLYTIYTAKKHGNAVMMYGCGIGPIVDKRDESAVRKILNGCVDVITLRESVSKAELEKMGVDRPKIIVSSDPAITLPCAPADRIDSEFEKFGLDPKGNYVCFVVRDWDGLAQKAAAFAQAADFVFSELGMTPVFVTINNREDRGATDAVRARMETETAVIDEAMDSPLAIGLLSRMKAVVSMRLHGLIFAASQGVPLVGVSYDPKVESFLESIGGELCLKYEELEAKELERMISLAVRQFEDMEKRKQVVERLIAIEALNSEWARTLLEKRDSSRS